MIFNYGPVFLHQALFIVCHNPLHTFTLTKKLKIMKKFIYKHRVLWISIIAAALIIVSMGSCSSTREGCAQHAGYIGYR